MRHSKIMSSTAEIKEQLSRIKEDLQAAREKLNDGGFEGEDSIQTELKKRKELRGHFGKVYAMHWAGSGSNMIVSASQDGKLIVWNAVSTNKIYGIPLRSSWVMTCAFEQTENKLVACGGLDNVCSIYSLNTEASINRATCELVGHDGYLSCCRFLNSEKLISSSGDSTCSLWNLRSHQRERQFTDHSGDAMSVSPSPSDPNIFVSGSCDATCKVWDVRVERAVITYEGHESDINDCCFFPNGMAFGSGSDDSTCRLYDLRSYQEINRFKNQNILCGITGLAFSSSGRLLFGGYDDFCCNVWDVLNPGMNNDVVPAQQLKNHQNRVSCVGVHHDGHALGTGSWDSLLRIFA